MGCGAAGVPKRGDSLGAVEHCPTACGCSCGLVSPALLCPRLSLGYRAPQRNAACKRERSRPPLSGFQAPHYITLDREEPAAASALPPLGPPRPRAHPAPRPAPRPPSAEPRRGSPSHMAVAAASSLRRTSLRCSRPLPWYVPASACQAQQSAVPRPSFSSRRSLLAPISLLSLTRVFRTAPPAVRRCGRQPDSLEERREGPQQRGRGVAGQTRAGREPRRRAKVESRERLRIAASLL